MCQQKRSASRGAVRTHMLSGGNEPSTAAETVQRLVQHPRAERTVVGEPRRGPARHHLQVERHPRAERAERDGLVVDRDYALPPAHLLLHEVPEQVASAACGWSRR